MKNLIIIFTLAAFLASCGQNKSTEEKPNATVGQDGLTASLPPIAYTGALIIGHEAQDFIDCASKENWWIEFDAVEDELANQYEDIAGETPYKAIYAEVRGYLEAPPEEGFPSDYDKVLNITEIVKLDDLDDGNDCTKTDATTDVN